jgi:hypothetical protein
MAGYQEDRRLTTESNGTQPLRGIDRPCVDPKGIETLNLTDSRIVALSATAVLDAVIVLATAPNFTLAANVLLVLLMVKSTVFVCLYAFRSNWTLTAAGRAVMGLIACMAAITGIGTLNLFLGDYPGRPFVRVACFVAVGLTLMNMLLALIAKQRNGGSGDE